MDNRADSLSTPVIEEERRNSDRVDFEIPVTFQIGRRAFFGTTTNFSDDGIKIESSFALENLRRILKHLLRTPECPIRINYALEGKRISRKGKIKHYHLDFPGGKSAYRFSFGVWIPKLRLREEKGL